MKLNEAKGVAGRFVSHRHTPGVPFGMGKEGTEHQRVENILQQRARESDT
jgi:hypothetical protein